MSLTKQFTILAVIFALPAVIITSCKKDAVTDITADATIINQGNPDADGCGWVIKINSSDSTYSPKNLPVLYEVSNLKVHITYKRLATRFQCGWLPGSGYTQIQIDAITKE